MYGCIYFKSMVHISYLCHFHSDKALTALAIGVYLRVACTNTYFYLHLNDILLIKAK